jgi:hypothetical protein
MTERKAKRKLSNIDFSGKDAHIALVSKQQGGPASGADYKLVLKSAKYTDEHLEKAAKIRITMDIEDFLVRFYNLMYEDAEVLARALGFDTAEEDMSEDEDKEQTYEDWITSRVEAIEVIKQLEQSENINKTLSELDPEDYLALLRSQQTLEKAMKSIAKAKKDSSSAVKTVAGEGATTAVASAKEVGTKEAKAVPSGKKTKTEKSNMTENVTVTETEKTVEVVEKSAFDELQKSLKDQKEQLTKALETVELYKKKEQESILKARKEQLKTTLVEDEKVEALFKALSGVDEELFQGAVKALEGLMLVQKSSELFKEQGASSATEQQPEETALMKAIKAATAVK